MKSRGKKNKKSASQSSSASSPGGTAVNSAATVPPPQQHRRAFSTLHPLEKYLVPRHSFKVRFNRTVIIFDIVSVSHWTIA